MVSISKGNSNSLWNHPPIINRNTHISFSRYHYWRSTTNNWTRTVLSHLNVTPTATGKRGKVVPYKSKLYLILPDNAENSTTLAITASTAAEHFRDWTTVLETDGNGWEPVFDRYRISGLGGRDEDGVLSMLVINGTEIQVWDLDLNQT